jgi:serine/threonine protein kinase
MALTTGQMLQDRYRIVSLLGQGGMGAVYRAWDTRLNVPVALKEMTSQPGLDYQALAKLRGQFQQEAQVLARLTHPHLVRVGDFFEEGGSAYLVMDFVEGESLAQCIEREGALPESDVLVWTEQLLNALAYCHSQGVIHRDIKPQNVILRSGGQAVLVDFGLVKLWDPSDPQTKTVMRGMGTPEYAPPEQYDVQMGHTDARSDIYGLGATLYHTLTGQAPPTATLRMADPEKFAPPRSLIRDVSSKMETAVMTALELARSQRWQSAAEMGAALGITGLATPAPTQSRTVPAMPRRGRTKVLPGGGPPAPARRSRPVWAWGLGTVAALGLVAVLAFGVMQMTKRGGASEDILTPTLSASQTATSVVPVSAEETATSTPSPAPTETATRPPTRPPTRTPARTPTFTPTHTPTPQPSLTATPIPPRSIVAELTAPAQGGEFKSPITFQWRGSLSAGQSYQVTARHPESSYVIQSELLTNPSWTADLPAERYGEWRWAVSVMQGGSAVTTSDEQMFWFNPGGGGGGGGGGGSGKNTPAPPDL